MNPEDHPSDADRGVHVYDDIVEEDNRLPRWWLGTLFGAMAFATFYWFGDQELKAWRSPREVYSDQMIALRLEEASRGGGISPDALVALARQPSAVAGGNIGPNLTDEFWLHGGAPDKIWKTVHDGVPSKGMAAWGPVLGETRVASAVAYVLTLRNTNVANGKAPQGEKEL